MDSLQPVLAVLARVLVGFSAAFLVPLAWALGIGEEGEARVWGYAMAMTLGLGVLLGWVLRRHTRELQPRDGFLLVTLVWVVLPACAAVPLMSLLVISRSTVPSTVKDPPEPFSTMMVALFETTIAPLYQ